MPRKQRKAVSLPIVKPNAAGIDIGARQIFVAVPADRDAEPVRCFQTFTIELQGLADWLQQYGIRTVAMKSTGVYWIPLFQILEKRKIDVPLDNAHHIKNVPGRKTELRTASGSRTCTLAGCCGAHFGRMMKSARSVRCGVTAITSLNSRPSTCSTCRKRSTR